MDQSDDPLLAPIFARLDRLHETIESRFEQLDQRLRGLEREAGEIIDLLVSIKASLDTAVEDLVEEADDDDDDDDDAETVWHFIH